MVQIGLNRWDFRGPREFAASVHHGEASGVDWAFLPVNALAIPDPYVLLAMAAMGTERIGLGPLLETPRLRPAAVAAGSIATVDALAPGRTMLTYGVGDTAVRWLGRRPARLTELEEETTQARSYLAGERLDVGAEAPAWLRHARRVPVWIAAGGPRSLEMAGRVADGVFLRVGTHPANVATAVDLIRAGALAAGRDPAEVRLALIVHTCRSEDPAEIRAISRAMAAGFYEYSPALFDPPGFSWDGPPIHELQEQVWPDFHHAADLVAAGGLVEFLDDDIASSFSCFGDVADVADQLNAVLAAVPEIDLVVPHPVPQPFGEDLYAYASWLGRTLKPLLR